MNGFHETRLDILLRGLGVETLIITGAWTNMSIEHTARHAADAGYRAVVASDGTSTVNDEWQNAALNYAMQNVAPVAHLRRDREALGLADAAYDLAVTTRRRPAAARARVRLGRDVPGRRSGHRRARRTRCRAWAPRRRARALEAAEARCPRGAALLAKERARILRRWSDLMLEHQEALARLLTTEQGKPLAESRVEIEYAASFFEWFGEEAKRVYGDTIPTVPARPPHRRHEGAGRRHRRDHAVELPGGDARRASRRPRSPPAARWC